MKNPHASGKVGAPNELKKFLIFRDLDDQGLANIALQLRVRKYRKGEQIIRQYEEDKTVYFLLAGIVRMVFPDVAINMGKRIIETPILLAVTAVLNALIGGFLTYKGFIG